MDAFNQVLNEANERIARTCAAFPSRLNQNIPDEIRAKLKPWPPMEDHCPPGVLLAECLPVWQKAIDEAMEHNEKVLGIAP